MTTADRLNAAAKKLRETAGACDPWMGSEGIGSWPDEYATDSGNGSDAALIRIMHPGVALALADWLDAEATGDGHRPHRYPEDAPAEVFSWSCQECGAVIREMYGPTTTCPVDWRPRDPRALAVADLILGDRP